MKKDLSAKADAMEPMEASEPKADKEYSEFELKDMAETLMKAHEIQSDAALMSELEPYLNKKSKAIRSIEDLKKTANSMPTGES